MPFFIFMFIFVALYGLLTKIKILGENVALNLVAAFCIAAVSTFAGTLITPLKTVIPWITFTILILVLLFAMYKFFGITDDEKIWDTIGGKTPYFVLVVLIVFISVVALYEPEVSPYAQGEQPTTTGTPTVPQGSNVQGEVIRTLTHPRLLGALFILIVASFSIRLIVDKME